MGGVAMLAVQHARALELVHKQLKGGFAPPKELAMEARPDLPVPAS